MTRRHNDFHPRNKEMEDGQLLSQVNLQVEELNTPYVESYHKQDWRFGEKVPSITTNDKSRDNIAW